MAGIFGFVGRPRAESVERTGEKLRRVLHQSKEEKIDLWTGAGACLGVVHLGILHPVTQPARDEKTGTRLVLDGEISEPESLLRRLRAAGVAAPADAGQPELLLRLFLTEGPEAFADLDGSWCVAVHSEAEGEIVLINDRFGSRQLMMLEHPWGFSFFPELKATLAFEDFRKEIDPNAVGELFTCEYILHERTLLEGVRLLPPASIARYRGGRLTVDAYWEIRFPEEYPILSKEDWIDEYALRLRRSVRRRLTSSPVTGTTLSGGVDTRLIASGMPQDLRRIHAFTFGERGCLDLRLARRVARAVSAEHHEILLRPEMVLDRMDRYVWFTDGMVTCRHGQIAALFPFVREHVDVLLEGLPAASEFFYMYDFAGFNILAPIREQEFLDYCVGVRTAGRPERLQAVLREPYASTLIEAPRAAILKALGEGFPPFPPNRSMRVSLLQRLRRFSCTGARYMRTVVEVRQPFYDYDLLEWALSVPGACFVDEGLLGKLIKRHAPGLVRIPIGSTELSVDPTLREEYWLWTRNRMARWLAGLTGGRIRTRSRKRTFDYGPWLFGPFRQRIEEVLNDARVADRGIFDQGEVRRVLAEHYGHEADHTHMIWILFGFELWCRLFFDGEHRGLEP